MALVEKKRGRLPISYPWMHYTPWAPPALVYEGVFDGTLEKQRIMTEGHDVSQLGNQSHQVRDIGGEFQSQKIEIIPSFREHNCSRLLSGQTALYSVTILPGAEVKSLLAYQVGANDESDTNFFNGHCPLASSISLDAFGSTAVARVKPLSPVFDVSVSVAELYREGLPGLINPTHNWGGEYLKYAFGYVPLASDAKAAYEAAVASDKLLQQLRRDSGKLIRRRYTEDPKVTSSLVDGFPSPTGAGGESASSGMFRGVGRGTKSTNTVETRWFSGAFTYYLPPNKGWRRSVAELDYLYGIKPGIDTAWNLMPWSWLIDYFGNAGDVFENLNAFTSDGLVMPYGYVMRKVVQTIQYSTPYQIRQGATYGTTVFLSECTVIKTTLQRRRAFPFGFGITDDSLTGRQLSILTALGISRL